MRNPEAAAIGLERSERAKAAEGLSRKLKKYFIYSQAFALGLALYISGEAGVNLPPDAKENFKSNVLKEPLAQDIYQVAEFNKTEKEIVNKLIDEIGIDNVAKIEALPSVKNAEERRQKMDEYDSQKQDFNIEGFGRLKQIGSNKKVENTINALPKFYRYNLSNVKYVDQELPSRSDLPKQIHGHKIGQAAHASRDEGLVFSKGAEEGGTKLLLEHVVPHELSHLADPFENKFMTEAERLALMQELIDRVNSPDRLKTWYVESIYDSDSKAQLLNKSTEYFAEINAYYFYKPNLLPAADKSLVERTIRKFDSDFGKKNQQHFEQVLAGIIAQSKNK